MTPVSRGGRWRRPCATRSRGWWPRVDSTRSGRASSPELIIVAEQQSSSHGVHDRLVRQPAVGRAPRSRSVGPPEMQQQRSRIDAIEVQRRPGDRIVRAEGREEFGVPAEKQVERGMAVIVSVAGAVREREVRVDDEVAIPVGDVVGHCSAVAASRRCPTPGIPRWQVPGTSPHRRSAHRAARVGSPMSA